MLPRNIYLDDSSISTLWNLANAEIYMICGYVIPIQAERELEKEMVTIKAKYGVSPAHPVKWNLRALRPFYATRNEESKLDHLIKNGDSLRIDLLSALRKRQYGVVLYASSILRLMDRQKPLLSYQRCFINLLQHAVKNLESTHNPHGLYLDFIKEDSDIMGDCYASSFHDGVDLEGNRFFCGPLRDRSMSQCLYFGKTNHNPFLQFADLVTGCVRDFLEYCFSGKDFDKVMKFFPKIMSKFCLDENSANPFRRGIIISPKTLYARLEKGWSRVVDGLATEFS